jgi:hypothetical protein
MKATIPTLLVATCLLAPATAMAGIDRADIFHGSAGALFTLGGDLWTAPDPIVDGIPFGDTAGGLGLGGGVFFEARFIKWIGVEIGLLFEHDHQWYSIEVNGGIAEAKYHLRYMLVRLPLLFKGVFDTPSMRVSIGIGPEFVFSRNARTDVEDLKNNITNIDTLKRNFGAQQQNDINLLVAIGFAFKVKMFSIPFNIRYAFNGTQPDGYTERLDPDGAAQNIVASASHDLRLMVGLAYDF